MKKRIISILLTAILLVCILPISASAAGSLNNFTRSKTYYSGLFNDVPYGSWYEEYVDAAYEYGLVNGKTTNTFEPDSYLKISEAIKIAACIHSIYYTGHANFSGGSPWYQPYVEYAFNNGIIDMDWPDYDAYATRAEFAYIFANALPSAALTQRNDINYGEIPDVSSSYWYGPSVYTLYRAGILTGSDAYGYYNPNTYIKRSEVATIAARMANSSYRKTFTLEYDEPGGDVSGYIGVDYNSALMYPGDTVEIIVSDYYLVADKAGYRVNDPSIATCSWGGWSYDGTENTLYITGLSSGTTTIDVYLAYDDNTIIDSTTIYVTVYEYEDNYEDIYYYAGLYPVPDYGYYVGASPDQLLQESGVISCFYKEYEHTYVDMYDAFDNYAYMLESEGFTLYDSYYNYQDYLTYVYYHYDYGYWVTFCLEYVQFDDYWGKGMRVIIEY